MLRRKFVTFDSVVDQIEDVDLLSWRRVGWWDTTFKASASIAGRGEHYHCGMAAWWSGDLFTIDACMAGGVSATQLSIQTHDNPGVIDVFKADALKRYPEFNKEKALAHMRRKCGKKYGRLQLYREALTHALVLRLFMRPSQDDLEESPDGLEFCSQAVTNAIRAGGVDTVLGISDGYTNPVQLTKSEFYYPGYRFTLVETESQVYHFTKLEEKLR